METRSIGEIARDIEQTRLAAKYALRDAAEVWSGRNAFASAWRSTRRAYLKTQDKVADSADAADTVVREHVYGSIGIALGIGAMVGYFLASRPRNKRKG